MLEALRHLCEAGAARAFFALPYAARLRLARAAARLWAGLDRKRSFSTLENLCRAFPVAGSEELLALRRGAYDNFALLAAEFPDLRGVNRDTEGGFFDWGGNDKIIESLLAEGRGVLFVSGHIGNWEACAAALAARGYVQGGIARPLDNPRLDRLVREVREGWGATAWDKSGALLRLYNALISGGGTGLLVDQDAGGNGEFVPFFGHPACTYTTHSDLALRSDAPLLPVAAHRTGRTRFKISLGEILRPDPAAEFDTERARLLRQTNLEIEKLIRRDPAQYLWQHRRWKTRPKSRPAGGK